MTHDEVRRGAGIYSKAVLSFYDLLVVSFSNRWAWRCRSHHMLEQYDRHIGVRHLDVGPGTGWYLERAKFLDTAHVTLLDLNPNSLGAAARKVSHLSHQKVVANVLEPLPEKYGAFDSIALNYVLHCIPGDWDQKGVALKHLGDRLADGGVLFGSTILGNGVDHNFIGRGLMRLYNRLGIFHNKDDNAAGLERQLRHYFGRVEFATRGRVALFAVAEPQG